VIGAPFDGFDSQRIVFAKFRVDRIQLRDGGIGERRDLRNAGLRTEGFQPLDFDQHAKADQAEFAEVLAQDFHLAVVAPVERGEGGEFGECGHDEVQMRKRTFYANQFSPCSMIAPPRQISPS